MRMCIAQRDALTSHWAVPILHVNFPRLPGETSSWEEKGQYALFLLWLFRPHRGPRDLVPGVDADDSTPCFMEGADIGANREKLWQTIYEEFCRWRRVDVHEVAASCQKRVADGQDRPAFDTPAWWACLVEEKLRNWDALTRKHHVIASAIPQNVDRLPEDNSASHAGPEGDEPKSDAQCQDLSEEQLFGGCHEEGVLSDGEDAPVPPLRPPRPSSAPQPVDVACGSLPAGATLDDYLRPPAKIHARSAELMYWRGFSDADLLSQPPAASDAAPIHVTQPWDVAAADALDASLLQAAFFKTADDRHLASAAPERDEELGDVDIADSAATGKLPQGGCGGQ